jgi:hypothetical protein
MEELWIGQPAPLADTSGYGFQTEMQLKVRGEDLLLYHMSDLIPLRVSA